MQIRTQLNDKCLRSQRENVVQEVSETADARENEKRVRGSSDDIQVPSHQSDLHEWSPCSIDKVKANCSFLIKYLLVNSFLLSFCEKFYFILSKCFRHQSHNRRPSTQQDETSTLVYCVQQLVIENSNLRMEAEAHKSLMLDKSFILCALHSTTTTTHQRHTKATANFYIKLYKILLNSFYEYFNNKTNRHHRCWHQQLPHHHPEKIYFNPHNSINTFCDLSTNNKGPCGGRGILFLINATGGIDQPSRLTRLRTLNILYGILLIQRHVMCNNSYEFSDNHNVSASGDVKHYILLQLLAHNQLILHVTSTTTKFRVLYDQSCRGIENGISKLGATSNHKLKATAPNDNDTCQHHRSDESEKLSNCYQHFHRAFRSNDSVKSHLNAILILIILCIPLLTAASSVHNLKYSTNVVKTKYGPLRGIILRSSPTVEGYFGVPYATPPLGSLRYMPPVTPSTWKNTRLADHFSPVCPQSVPVSDTGMEALLEMPRGRLAQLRRMKSMLTNHSEDCLYLNMYIPREDETGASIDKPMATLVYIHGESYEWNSGNLYDGTVLAAHSNIIVVTINFRLGVLGFLKTGTKGSAQGNFGLMDLVAGLHWLRENLPAFNGNPNMVTLMGHGHGAALANILIVSPVASDLIHRAILISGSALSPWAIQRDPLSVKKKVAADTGCHGDLLEDDLAPCLRKKSISELLAIKLDPPRFLPGFAPFVDGTVIVNPAITPIAPLSVPAGSAVAGPAGIELADFPTRELLFGVTSIESYLDFSAQDLEFGFNETRRDRILRTYVRNVYHFHLNEIFSALKNEYTDWERPPRNQLGSRDAALELLSDGHTVAPLIRLGYLHSLRGGKSYFMHYKHRTGERDFPQRYGTVRGEDVPFCLGLPLTPLFPYNYTQQDIQTSRILIHYLANFIQTGNPNGDATPTTKNSIEIDSLKRLGSTSNIHHLTESLPEPSLLSSSTAVILKSSTSTDSSSSTEEGNNINQETHNDGVVTESKNDGRIVVETPQQQQQPQFIHHALSAAKNRHRRSLVSSSSSSSSGSNSNANRRLISQRYIVKRNFPNNQLSKASNEMEADDSNETELDGTDDGENDDYIERGEEEDEDEKTQDKQLNILNGPDRLDDDDNEGDLGKSMKLFVPFWDAYDTVNQLFLDINTKPEIKNHYRGHKLSMWLSLIPQIHSPGDSPDLSMRHHHFIEENPQFYDGKVRLQTLARPNVIKINAPSTTASPKQKTEKTPSPIMPSMTTECPTNATNTVVPTIAATRPHQSPDAAGVINNNSLLRRLTSTHYQSYATALTVTIAVGCFLLLLNVFIFAAIYYQREKRATYTKKKEELTEAENLNSSSSPSLERFHQKGSRKSSLQSVSGAGFGEYSCYDEKLRCKEKRALVDLCTVELPLQEFKYSPPCGSTNSSIRRSITPEHFNNKHQMMDHRSSQDGFQMLPPSYAPQINGSNNLVTYRSIIIPKAELCNQATQADSPPQLHDVSTTVEEDDQELSPDLPEAPPPPRSSFQSGILRQGSSQPATPGTSKKRVQIQEISV